MDACLITGAILALMIASAHSYLGERYLLSRLLRRTGLPHLFGSENFTRQTLRLAWHLTSLAWLGLAAVLISFSFEDPLRSRTLALQAISISFMLQSMLTLFATRARHLAWIVLLAIALAAWLGIG
ncbi:MAG: hypothetical protein E4G89_07460 [Methanothrix sp.]|nr:MAG: hypothetical protein E4G89_07460 [Methanothrix sp.]